MLKQLLGYFVCEDLLGGSYFFLEGMNFNGKYAQGTFYIHNR